MGWLDYDVRAWTAIRDEARQGVRKQVQFPIHGSDLRRDAVAMADANARAAGIGNLLRFEQRDLKDWRPPAGQPGVVVCNPPYGERLGEEKQVLELYKLMGEVLRQHCAGWTIWVFSGNPRLEELIGITPLERIPLYNGRIRCRWLKYEP
jgi:putative N6-adenine-specific DNA methylase